MEKMTSTSSTDLPHCVLALIFGELAALDLRAVAAVCSAWRAAEAEMQGLLWKRFAPAAFPAHLAKSAALNHLLFEKLLGHRRLGDTDRLAFESIREEAPPFTSSMSAMLLQGLSAIGAVGSSSDAFALRRHKVLVAGPRGSGKTSVIDAFMNRPARWAVRAHQTFQVEETVEASARVQLWELPFAAGYGVLGGSIRFNHIITKRAKSLIEGAEGFIYVCDGQMASDDARVLSNLLAEPHLAGLPLLVLASKHDLTPRAPAEVAVALGLLTVSPSLRWRVQPCSLVGNTGLVSNERAELRTGLTWLVREMRLAASASGGSSLHATLRMLALPAPVCWVAKEMWEAGGTLLSRERLTQSNN